MDALNIVETQDTPGIILDKENSVFEITKNSLPEDAVEFYSPALYWLEKYADSSNEKTVFEFKLDYFNTASSKQIIKIMLLLERVSEFSDVLVKWYYSSIDEDMQAMGERYRDIVQLNFEFIEVEEE